VSRLRDDVARVEGRLPLVLKVGVPVCVVSLGSGLLMPHSALFAAGGTAVLMLALWAPLALFVTRRSRQLSAVAARVAAGDLAARVPGADMLSRDQLLTVSGEFNRMLDGLQATHREMRSILETATDAYVGMDVDGLVDDWNDAAERVFGWSRSEAIGQNLGQLIVPPALRRAHDEGLRNYQASRNGPVLGRSMEILALRRNGQEFPAELTVWASWGHGSRRFNGLIRDVTERKRLESELTHRALHDSLTGLSNRTLFGDRLEHALSRRATDALAVLYLDLDDFKMVNDSLGHSVGDQLLVAVSTRLSSVLRPSDTLARLAGDEFTLLAEEIAGLPEAEQIAERLINALRAPFLVAGREMIVRASIGIAMHRSPDTNAEGLLRNADVAMYTAKRSNKSHYAVFEEKMHDAALQRLELKADLERALERGELRVHFQPYIELRSGDVLGFEALVRWDHPERGLLPPKAFIPLAEETGLVRAIDRWVLAEATQQAARWAADRRGSVPLTMSVNVSPRDLQDPAFVQDVITALARTGLAPSTLVLEVTESALTEDVDVVAERLHRLSTLGVRIAIDDYGTGFSSLANLTRFPIDTFKIDKCFVDGLLTDSDSPMAEAILDIGRTLRLQTVAEGVESHAQLDRLRALGCQVAQGYVFARPLPPEQAWAWLASRLDSRAEESDDSGGHLALPV
jgi:diguanylate cyclase (GGDEF)-like protein/PAS domain S-box-containing protein